MAENKRQEKTQSCFEQDVNHFEYSKEKFYAHFQQECGQIQEQITNLEKLSHQVPEKHHAIDHILAGITRLSDEVADAGNNITAYNRRTYSQAIKRLEEKLFEAQTRMTPKPKFQFKTRFNSVSKACKRSEDGITAVGCLQKLVAKTEDPTEKSSSNIPIPCSITSTKEVGHYDDIDLPLKDYNSELTQGATGTRKPSFSKAKSIDISDHQDLYIVLPLSASRATSSGSIIKLTRCILDMSIPTIRPFSSLVLRDIKSSLIIAGCVVGPIHITKAMNSIIVVSSGQIRMHDCINVKMYVHCTSRPIIEDCNKIQFSTLPKCYTAVRQGSTKNQWDQIDDFKWLKSEPSPNWRRLPEEEKIDEEVWRDIAPGRMGIELADILEKLVIQTCSDNHC